MMEQKGKFIIQRGSIALATNGQAAFTYFDAIEVKAYDPNFPIISEKEEEIKQLENSNKELLE